MKKNQVKKLQNRMKTAAPSVKITYKKKNNRSFLAEHSKKHAIAYRKTVSECYGCFSFVKSMIV